MKKEHGEQQSWIHGGMQQIGIGVRSLEKTKKFYEKLLGFSIVLFHDRGVAREMLRYTGAMSCEREAVLVAHPHGGAALELWEHKEHTKQPMEKEIGVDSLGILCPYLRCVEIDRVRKKLREIENIETTRIAELPDGTRRCYVRDPDYNWVGFVETTQGWATSSRTVARAFLRSKTATAVGGVCGVLIGVSRMNDALKFYQDVCGYDSIVYDETDRWRDLEAFRGQQKARRVLLKRSEKNRGVFAHLLQNSFIELVEAEVPGEHCYGDYTKRFWGDPGYIHVCFDMKKMEGFRMHCEKKGISFTVDTGENEFKMGNSLGRFAYFEDPDRTLIECVEVYELSLSKRPRVVLRVRARTKPLPKIFIRALSLKKTSLPRKKK